MSKVEYIRINLVGQEEGILLHSNGVMGHNYLQETLNDVKGQLISNQDEITFYERTRNNKKTRVVKMAHVTDYIIMEDLEYD